MAWRGVEWMTTDLHGYMIYEHGYVGNACSVSAAARHTHNLIRTIRVVICTSANDHVDPLFGGLPRPADAVKRHEYCRCS